MHPRSGIFCLRKLRIFVFFWLFSLKKTQKINKKISQGKIHPSSVLQKKFHHSEKMPPDKMKKIIKKKKKKVFFRNFFFWFWKFLIFFKNQSCFPTAFLWLSTLKRNSQVVKNHRNTSRCHLWCVVLVTFLFLRVKLKKKKKLVFDLEQKKKKIVF